MTEIRTNLEGFERINKESGNPIFESEEAVITISHGIIIVAEKETKEKIYKESLPLVSLGVSGVASWEHTLLKEDTLRLCQKCGKPHTRRKKANP